MIPYLVFTLLSIVVSLAVFYYLMECSDISKNDREEFNSKIYNFIVEEDNRTDKSQSNVSKMTEKLLWNRKIMNKRSF